jgi:hypothetical protein
VRVRHQLDGVHRAGPVPPQGIDHDAERGAVPLAEEVEGRGQGAQLRHAGEARPRPAEDGGPDTVVPSELAPDRRHHDGRSEGVAHRRVTVTSRKCVAHEMQGSWLRTACSLLQVSSSSVRSRADWTARRTSDSITIWF